MRRALFAIACALTLGLAWRYRCLGKHDPRRDTATRGYRCRTCGRAFADLDEAGVLDGAYLRPIGSTYGRGRGEGVTRSAR